MHEPGGERRRDRLGARHVLGLGLAGGLTPSPTALLVLLGATAAGRPLAGVVAVVAFGAGMAATLTVVGVVAGLLREGWARRPAPTFVRRLTEEHRLRAFRGMVDVSPLVPAVGVVVAGGVLTLRGVSAAMGV